jgi:hypothetical protein
VFGFGLPTGGKGHGGDEEDLLCWAKRSREACADLFWVLETRRYGVICLLSRSAQERLALMYLLACLGFLVALN